MPSALFSSNYSATANNILNKFDNAPIYDSATGAWTFKDNAGNSLISATTSAITLNKATTIGPTTGTTATDHIFSNMGSGIRPFTFSVPNGNVGLYLTSSSGSNSVIATTNNSGLLIRVNTSTNVIQIENSGAVTIGPSSGYTSLRHSIYCEETATAGSINKYIIVNVNGGTYKMAVYNA